MTTHAVVTDKVVRRSPTGSNSFNRALWLAAIAGVLVTVGSWLAGTYWMLELLTHFRIQYIVGATVLAAVAVVSRNRRTAIAATIVVAANLAPVWPYFVPGTIDVQAGRAAMRIMSFNVGMRNRNYDAALATVENEDPDLVGFLEVDRAWADRLSELHAVYPHSILRPEDGAYGLALFSRFPFRELEASPYVEDGVQTAIMIEVEIQDAPVSLILAHLMAPTSADRASLRNRQLETLAETIRNDGNREQILVGDLNTTQWSPHYAQLEDRAGLANAALARGYLPTWPTGYFPVKIPIDHCLLSDGLQVQQFLTGSDIGSDHLPIIADITVGGLALHDAT